MRDYYGSRSAELCSCSRIASTVTVLVVAVGVTKLHWNNVARLLPQGLARRKSKYGELLHYWMDLSAELSNCVNYEFEYVQEIDLNWMVSLCVTLSLCAKSLKSYFKSLNNEYFNKFSSIIMQFISSIEAYTMQ